VYYTCIIGGSVNSTNANPFCAHKRMPTSCFKSTHDTMVTVNRRNCETINHSGADFRSAFANLGCVTGPFQGHARDAPLKATEIVPTHSSLAQGAFSIVSNMLP